MAESPRVAVREARRPQQSRLEKVGRRRAGQAFEQHAEREIHLIAVAEARANRRLGRESAQPAEHGVVRQAVQQQQVRPRQPRALRHQIPHRERPRQRRIPQRELRQVLHDRIVDAELPFVGQDAQAGHGEGLRGGRDVERRVLVHLLGPPDLADPVAARKHDLAVTDDRDGNAGRVEPRDCGGDQGLERRRRNRRLSEGENDDRGEDPRSRRFRSLPKTLVDMTRRC